MTPKEKFKGDINLLPASFRLSKRIAITPGYIHLIRFIRSDHIPDIFGKKFVRPKEVKYEYVWATIDTAQEKLFVYHDSKLIVKYPYPLPKSSIYLSKTICRVYAL